MFENNLYNLMLQLTEEHKSLWRIRNEYLQDSAADAEAKAFWEKLAQDKENHIAELKNLIKSRI